MKAHLINAECLAVMAKLPDHCVDAIICDPPYGTTACGWDSVIPLDAMWEQLKRIIKPNGAIVLFGSEPFSTMVRASNIEQYKYDWYWLKNRVTGFTQAKNKPMKNIELISVFSTGTTVHASQSKNRMTYNPQGLIPCNKKMKNSESKFGTINGKRPSHKESYTQKFTNYPKMTLEFDGEHGLHPTQKPVALMEYLVRTYTNEGERVLDFTMGSGTTGVACVNTNRNFIGIELNGEYFKAAEERIEKARQTQKDSLL